VLGAAGETETTQENIQDWIELDEGDTGLQLLTEEEIAALYFLFISISTALLLNFPSICFMFPFCLLGLSFLQLSRLLVSPDNLPPSKLFRSMEGLL
jgi:hypothetical protein